ncbi:MFS transporter [Deinococcus sp.]|uniref:MFS transporter n=1 Tax=Deinococcus sp. TaxID=47478 RepID=UPI0025D64EFA|nr:MFS transporter [Deinococcus sp.]
MPELNIEAVSGLISACEQAEQGVAEGAGDGRLTGGRLGDLYGRRRMFLLGLAGFTLTSALCGLAWSPLALIVFRVLQGLLGWIRG